ncbi:hypothetical protein EP51_05115 [Rhodococcus opacus]|uniref:TerD domain-containing protein n=1 Tax=Rhodococcus opacus TaxID=37919 RepID=A0A076EEE6_RHOOP|nr:hypothetical protein EP51_05115 [Rhodococcus opacus]
MVAVEQVDVVLGWTESEVEVDASALLLDSGGKVRSDEDLVFYNQPESTDGSIRFLGTSGTEEGGHAPDGRERASDRRIDIACSFFSFYGGVWVL